MKRFLFGLFVGLAQFSQDMKLTEVESLKLQLQVEKQRRIEAEYGAAGCKKIGDDASALDKETSEIMEKIFKEHNMDRTKFSISLEKGEFIPKAEK